MKTLSLAAGLAALLVTLVSPPASARSSEQASLDAARAFGETLAAFKLQQADGSVAGRLHPFIMEKQLRELREASPEGPLHFNLLGDSRPEFRWLLRLFFPKRRVFYRLLRNMEEDEPDFLLHLGDVVPRGRAKEYKRLEKNLERIDSDWPMFVSIGNHERIARGGAESYEVHFGTRNYSFDYKGFRFICLDSSGFRVDAAQLDWLQARLDTPLRKIVFTHMPPWALRNWRTGTRGSGDAEVRPGEINSSWRGFKEGSRAFIDLVAGAGVERVYFGHVHGFGYADYKGVRWVLSGGGGSPLYPWGAAKKRFYHYIGVTVGADGMIREQVCDKTKSCRPIEDYPKTDAVLFEP